MKMYHLFITSLLALSLTTVAVAQDEFGGSFGGGDEGGETDSAPAYTAPSVQTNVSSSASMTDETLSYPRFALGSRLELVVPNMVSAALIEANLEIISRLTIFVVTGFYVHTYRVADNADPPNETVQREGAIYFGGGARFNFREPAPGRAHMYASLDLGGGIGLATQEFNGDADSELEDSIKEQWDFFTFGLGLGIDYLIVPEFSIGPEVGVRYILDRDKDNAYWAGISLDKAYDSWLATSFALRFTYHF